MPAHVVAYATGSALSAGQDAKLTAIDAAVTSYLDGAITDVPAATLTAAQATPIHSDLRKVTGTSVTGSGTEIDPWGP